MWMCLPTADINLQMGHQRIHRTDGIPRASHVLWYGCRTFYNLFTISKRHWSANTYETFSYESVID